MIQHQQYDYYIYMLLEFDLINTSAWNKNEQCKK